MRLLFLCPICKKKFFSKKEMLEHHQTHTKEEKAEFNTKESKSKPSSKPSSAWILVPIIFAALGGLIAYVGLKNEDKELADNLLCWGIVLTIVYAFLALLWISNIL